MGYGDKNHTFVQRQEEMFVTELPFNLPGRIFFSPMPFTIYDPQEKGLTDFRRKNVSVIVLLAQKEECIQKAGRDLKSLYHKEGFQVIYLPIQDLCRL